MKLIYFLLLLFFFGFISCKKDWLEIKPDKALVVPANLEDLQALLDNNTYIFNAGQPSLGEIGSNDFFISYGNWQSLTSASMQNAYIWAPDIYEGATSTHWDNPYKQVFYSNVALEGVDKITPTLVNQSSWNNVKGSALFYRAYAFLSLAQTFAPPYDQNTASTDPGIPVRLSADINDLSVRASIRQTYDQIIADLTAAKDLLPASPLFKTRPSRPACFALLARTYLAMQLYQHSFSYADSTLQLYNTLMDFNSLDSTQTNPIKIFNPEVIFHSTMINLTIFSTSRLMVDSFLFRSYHSNDLRRPIYFTINSGNRTFRGSYSGGSTLFDGLTTDEMLLIRAESNARNGNVNEALNDLNALLAKRWRNTVPYVPVAAANASEAIEKILTERRKELVFRGARWNDLRRLNKDPQYAVTLTRVLNGQAFTLPPNDKKYVLPIPDNEIQLSGIQQNPR